MIAGRTEETLAEAAEEIGCEYVVGDIRDADGAAGIAAAAGSSLDLLVNNAGGQYFVPAESITAKGWAAVMRLNVEGTMTMTEAALPALRAASGTVVNVTVSPHHGMPAMAHTGAARAAVEALTAELSAREPDVSLHRCGDRPLRHRVAAQVPRGRPARRRSQRPASAPGPHGGVRLADRAARVAGRPRA